MDRDAPRTARVEARIAPEALVLIKRAAEMQGRSVSDFLVSAAYDVAKRTIEEAQLIRLSMEDQHNFAQAILQAPPPGEGLARAARSYRKLFKEPG